MRKINVANRRRKKKFKVKERGMPESEKWRRRDSKKEKTLLERSAQNNTGVKRATEGSRCSRN